MELTSEELSFDRKRSYTNMKVLLSAVLTAKEMERFNSLKGRRKIEYLAGRWSAKEAFSKAMGTGIWQAQFSGFRSLEQ